MLLSILNKLESSLGTKDGGMSWECVVKVAIILQMLEAALWGHIGPFGLSPGAITPALRFLTLPADVLTLTAARVHILQAALTCGEPTMIYVDSAGAEFPEFEGFAVYTEGTAKSTKMVGFQMKSGAAKPRHPIDTNVISGGGLLIRGRAPNRPRRPSAPEGWTFMDALMLRTFLGTSLLLAIPRAWLTAAEKS
jgi:hypothetical protein